MKERPILFSGPMVRAILAGTKTQTRRVVKERHIDAAPPVHFFQYLRENCPYGQPGDRLWVREAIRLVPDQEPDDGTGRVLSVYTADGELTVADAWPWRRSYLPPMHCPRGLSRITLEITDVRVERLQDIIAKDAIAEGVNVHPDHHGKPSTSIYSPVQAFRDLWEQINGPGSWDANSWVWALEFRRIAP